MGKTKKRAGQNAAQEEIIKLRQSGDIGAQKQSQLINKFSGDLPEPQFDLDEVKGYEEDYQRNQDKINSENPSRDAEKQQLQDKVNSKIVEFLERYLDTNKGKKLVEELENQKKEIKENKSVNQVVDDFKEDEIYREVNSEISGDNPLAEESKLARSNVLPILRLTLHKLFRNKNMFSKPIEAIKESANSALEKFIDEKYKPLQKLNVESGGKRKKHRTLRKQRKNKRSKKH